MTECTTGSHLTELLVRFLYIFALHAAPLAYLFVRWGHRYYLGFFPAFFTALAFVVYGDVESPCAVIQTKFDSVMLSAVLVGVSYLWFVFFKPTLHFLALFGETHIPVFLAAPILGALYAAVWLLLSMRRSRLLMENGGPVTFRFRVFETLAHGVVVGFGLVLLAAVASKGVPPA